VKNKLTQVTRMTTYFKAKQMLRWYCSILLLETGEIELHWAD